MALNRSLEKFIFPRMLRQPVDKIIYWGQLLKTTSAPN
jgi:hypothetical protein